MDKSVHTSGNKSFDICLSSDLKIISTCIDPLGDDSGVGSFTYISSLGHRMIDYVLMSYNFFEYIYNIVIHDLHTCM